MGILSSIKKGFKKIGRGFKKVFKKVGKFLASKWGKRLMIAVSIFTMGTALLAGGAAFQAAAATGAKGFMAKFVIGGKAFAGALVKGGATKAAEGASAAGAVTGTVGAASTASNAAKMAQLAAGGASNAANVGGGFLATAGDLAGKAVKAGVSFVKSDSGRKMITDGIKGYAEGKQEEERFNREIKEKRRLSAGFNQVDFDQMMGNAGPAATNQAEGGYLQRADAYSAQPQQTQYVPGNPNDVYGQYITGGS